MLIDQTLAAQSSSVVAALVFHSFSPSFPPVGVLASFLATPFPAVCRFWTPSPPPARAGKLLGGHDKDLYIAITGPGYSGRPLTDVKVRAARRGTQGPPCRVRWGGQPGLASPRHQRARQRGWSGPLAGLQVSGLVMAGGLLCQKRAGSCRRAHACAQAAAISTDTCAVFTVLLQEGGCVVTCAAFERKAGRELSKKWKVGGTQC